MMKSINNPIDDIEKKLAKQVKNKATDVIGDQDPGMELLKSSKEMFNSIFNSMNNYKKEEKHIDVH